MVTMKKHMVISIGHGENTYEESGSKGVRKNGRVYEEHDANCHLAMKVKKLVEAHGIKVTLVQPPHGRDVPLRVRTNKANSLGVDLYWSIHHNAGVSSARGACSFYWHTNPVGRKLSETLARNMKAKGIDTHGSGVHASKRGSWTNFHEVRETKMTAILTENGFMTNPRDFVNIFGSNQEEYHTKMAHAHAKTIIESFYGMEYDPNKTSVSSDAWKDYKPTSEDYARGRIGRVKITTPHLNLREGKSLDSKIIKVLDGGGIHYCYDIDGKWHNLGGGWASAGSDGDLLEFAPFPPQPKVEENTHVVVSGDTLWGLAQKYNTSVDKLKELNGLESDLLQIGQVLRVNDKAPLIHEVVKGDTLWGIAQEYDTSVSKIKELNGLKSDLINIGDELRVK